MQRELKIAPVERERRAPIVIAHASVAQRQLPDAQIEKRGPPGTARRPVLGTRHVAVPVLVDRHRNFRLVHDHLVERNLVPEKRQDANSHVNAIGMKQRRRAGPLEPMHRQVADPDGQAARD